MLELVSHHSPAMRRLAEPTKDVEAQYYFPILASRAQRSGCSCVDLGIQKSVCLVRG